MTSDDYGGVSELYSEIIKLFRAALAGEGTAEPLLVDNDTAIDSFVAVSGVARAFPDRLVEFQIDKLRTASQAIRLLGELHDDRPATENALERLQAAWYSVLRLSAEEAMAMREVVRDLGVAESSTERVVTWVRRQ